MIWPMQMGDTVPGDMECGRRLLPWKQVGSYFWGGQTVGGQYQTDGRKRSPPPTHLLLLVILMKGKIFVQLTEIILYWWVKLMFERSECCLVYFLIRIFIYLFLPLPLQGYYCNEFRVKPTCKNPSRVIFTLISCEDAARRVADLTLTQGTRRRNHVPLGMDI